MRKGGEDLALPLLKSTHRWRDEEQTIPPTNMRYESFHVCGAAEPMRVRGGGPMAWEMEENPNPAVLCTRRVSVSFG